VLEAVDAHRVYVGQETLAVEIVSLSLPDEAQIVSNRCDFDIEGVICIIGIAVIG
jgi:hypothetical protein